MRRRCLLLLGLIALGLPAVGSSCPAGRPRLLGPPNRPLKDREYKGEILRLILLDVEDQTEFNVSIEDASGGAFGRLGSWLASGLLREGRDREGGVGRPSEEHGGLHLAAHGNMISVIDTAIKHNPFDEKVKPLTFVGTTPGDFLWAMQGNVESLEVKYLRTNLTPLETWPSRSETKETLTLARCSTPLLLMGHCAGTRSCMSR